MKTAPNRWWDWTAALVFMAALVTVSYRLMDTKWTEDLNLVTTLTILGAVIGMLLGLSRFKRLTAALLGIGYSAAMLSWQMAHVIQGDVLYSEKLTSVGGRLWTSFNLFLRNEPVTDPVLFLANMSLLFWIVALVGGYNLTRYGKPWLSIVVAGITVLVIDIYHPAVGVRGVAMALYAVLALLLLARIHFLKRKREWEGEQISVDSDAGFIWGRGGLVTAIVLVILAWNVSSVVKAFNPATPEHRRASNVWGDLRDRFENLVDPLRGTSVVPREYFGERFSLGSGSQLSDREVFRVEPNIRGRSGVPYYWQVRTYDRYVEGYWESSINETKPLTPTFSKIDYSESFRSRTAVSFRFHPQRNLNMLYAPSIPLAFSRSVKIMPDLVDGKTADVTSVTISPMVRAGETYEVVSMIASPTVLQLQQAGTIYPEWTDKYLQLPADLPQSIRDLAEEITVGLDTPYDKAEAVTMWLRQNIEYKAVLPVVPPGKDPIEWMLFDQKQAFCNYYATAEVLMLRHLGIPGRWAAGYAQGEYNPDARAYIVREADSHAWPEVFFPNYGWVEFEPTASQDDIARPSGLGNAASGSNDPNTDIYMDEGRRGLQEDNELPPEFTAPPEVVPVGQTVLRIAVITGIVLMLAGFVFMIIRSGRRNAQRAFPVLVEKTLKKRGWKVPVWIDEWSRFIELTPMAKLFMQMQCLERFLRLPARASATPSERVHRLTAALPEGESQANTLLEEYHQDMFSPRPGDVVAAKAAMQELWRLAAKERLRALGAWFTAGRKPAPPGNLAKPG